MPITKPCSECGCPVTRCPSYFRATIYCKGCWGSKAKSDPERGPVYQTWIHMRDRCLNPANRSYARYGGRGISIYGEWLTSFEAFFSYMGPRPSMSHSIGRIDNDGNYAPG